MQKLRLSRINTWLAGKIFLYMINAYKDAKLAEELIKYWQDRDRGVLGSRTRKLIESAPGGYDTTDDYVLGLAYTQYYANGIYDFMYANLFAKFFFGQNRKAFLALLKKESKRYAKKIEAKIYFQEYNPKYARVIRPIIDMLFGKLTFERDFLRRIQRGEKLKREEVIPAMISVQEQNQENNKYFADKLELGKPTKESKVRLIRRLAKEFEYQEVFLKTCISSLHSASRWDRWFVRLLEMRFGGE